MKNYPINNVPRSVIEFSRNEYEEFLKATEEKIENIFQIQENDSLILDYQKFESVRRLTYQNLEKFEKQLEESNKQILTVKEHIKQEEDQMKIFKNLKLNQF